MPQMQLSNKTSASKSTLTAIAAPPVSMAINQVKVKVLID
jgi:hypothetical protein